MRGTGKYDLEAATALAAAPDEPLHLRVVEQLADEAEEEAGEIVPVKVR